MERRATLLSQVSLVRLASHFSIPTSGKLKVRCSNNLSHTRFHLLSLACLLEASAICRNDAVHVVQPFQVGQVL